MLFTQIHPMLLTMGSVDLLEQIENPNQYITELKFDGIRVLWHKQGDTIKTFTKNGNPITSFPEFTELADSIRCKEAILDCEAICTDSKGRPIFDYVNNRLRIKNPLKIASARAKHPATLMAFDVLWADGSLVDRSLIERKQILKDIIFPSASIMPVPYVEGVSKEVYEFAEQHDLEGIVLKRKDSKYEFARSKNLIKIKRFKTLDVVVLAYRTNPFGLIVGAHFPTVKNKPLCLVEHGFSQEEKRAFLTVAQQIRTRTEKNIHWVQPLLCARIKYLDRTESHSLRITSFVEFLPNKHPDECVWVA